MFERGAHRRERERIGRERRPHARVSCGCRGAHVGQALRHRVGKAPDAGGHAAGDRLAEHEQVGFEAVRPRIAARSGRNRVRLVDQQQRSGAPRQPAQLVVEPGLGQHHAGVGHHRLGDHARDVAMRQRLLERRQDSLNSTTRANCVRSFGCPSSPGRLTGLPSTEAQVGLVHRAVVAAVEDEDLRASGDGARHPQCEPVRVGRGGRDLPVRQPEPLHQQLAHRNRILGGKHVGEPATGLATNRLDDRRRRMAEHRSGVAEAEVGILIAVDVAQHRPERLLHQERERHRPVFHPVHGHAVVEAGDAPAGPPQRNRVTVDVCGTLRSEDRGDARNGDAPGRGSGHGIGSATAETSRIVVPRARFLDAIPRTVDTATRDEDVSDPHARSPLVVAPLIRSGAERARLVRRIPGPISASHRGMGLLLSAPGSSRQRSRE